jgi:hypothetical protein
MPVTYKRAPDDFRALIHKAGNESIGVSYDRYNSTDILACRIWIKTQTEGEFHSSSHGLNLTPQLFAEAIPFISFILDGKLCGDPVEHTRFPLSGNKFFQVTRQDFRGVGLVAARIWNRTKEGVERPTGQGLTLRPALWLQVIPILKEVLLDIGFDVDAISEMYENSVPMSVKGNL